MRIAVVAGVVVQHDAISAAAVEQVAVLRTLPGVEDVRLFTQGLDREPGCSTYITGNPWELLRHPDFRSCDVAIFHWGIHFALFDAITLLASTGLPKPVVHFHNCTPPWLVEEAQRDKILRSIRQFHHVIATGAAMWTHSEFNRRTLIDWGATEAQITLVTFPILMPELRTQPRSDDSIHLLSVGRLVPAKGVHVLLDALALLRQQLLDRIRLRIVSHPTFSSEEYRQSLDEQIRNGPRTLATAVKFLTSASDTALAKIYQETDVVIAASFHEGLCVPVLEGYSAGCRAIGTTEGNLPFVVIPPDPVVPPADPAALAAAIECVVADPVVDDPGYHERRRALVESFTPPCARQMLWNALTEVHEREFN